MALGKLTRNTHGDPAVCVAGVDGTPGGWAVIIKDQKKSVVKKFASIADLFHEHPKLRAVAIDIPIGLLDVYEPGGRTCDRVARSLLGRTRGSSVFPASSSVRPLGGVLAPSMRKFACRWPASERD